MLTAIIIHFILLKYAASNSLSEFVTVKGYRFDFHSLRTFHEESRLACIVICLETVGCKSVNTKSSGDSVECDLQDYATENVIYWTEDIGSTYSYPITLRRDCEDLYPPPNSNCPVVQYASQNQPHGWKFHCTTGQISIRNFLPIHKNRACQLKCDPYTSCVYYQLDTNFCYVCIKDNLQYDDAELISITSDITLEANMRSNIFSVLFQASDCRGDVRPLVKTPYKFDYHESRVTAVHFCACNWGGFKYTTAGFTLDVNYVEQSTHSCPYYYDAYERIDFPSDETVLAVDMYTGYASGYHVVRAVTFHTDKASYGPVGTPSWSTRHTETGYNFLGFSGYNGYALDSVGVNFEFC